MPSSVNKGWDFRSYLAVLMATIATFGALTAYRAAIAEDDVAGQMRLYDESQILELDKRQRYLDDLAASAGYERRTSALRAQAKKFGSDPLSRMNAQEDLAAARVTQRYADFYDWDTQGYGLENRLENLAAGDLGDLGFNVSWDPAWNNSASEPPIFDEQLNEVKGLGTELTLLTGAVVLFILALLALTVADLVAPQRRKNWLIVSLAVSTVAAALVLVRLHDVVTILFAVAGAIAVAALSVKLFTMSARSAAETGPPDRRNLGRRLGEWWSALVTPSASHEDEEHDTPAAELEPTGYIGSRVLSRTTHGAFARTVVIAIALTALLSAFCGFLYSRAAAKLNTFSSAAVSDQATEFRESSRSRAVANTLVDAVAGVQEDQARADATEQALQLYSEHLLDANSSVVNDEYTLRQAIYQDDLDKLKSDEDEVALLLVSSDEIAAVPRDPLFPTRLVQDRASFGSDRAFALWDADNQAAQAYQRKMSVYLAGLTLFAISLYLFGQSMGIEGFLATRILAAVATVFALVGGTVMVWTAVGASLSLPVAAVKTMALPEACKDQIKSYTVAEKTARFQAAEHYACGRHLERIGQTPADYQRAADQYQLALAYRPGFALARAAHASMAGHATAPQDNAVYTSLPSANVEDVKRNVAEERAAAFELHDQGFDNPDVISNLGYDVYVLGLMTSNRGYVEEGARDVAAGLEIYRRYGRANGFALMNEALLLAARGRFEDAETRYRELARLPQGMMTSSMALGGMTDLELLNSRCSNLLDAKQCEQLNDALPQWKADVAGAVEAWRPPLASIDPPPTTVVGDFAQVTPGSASWKAHVPGGGKGDSLLAIWYVFDPAWHVWVAQPQLQQTPQTLDEYGAASAFKAALPAMSYERCMGMGTYRVEFYWQGRPAGSVETTQTSDGYSASFDPRLSLAVCSPPGWARDNKNSQNGTATLIYPSSHRNALMLVRRDDPEPGAGLGASSVALREVGEVLQTDVEPGTNGDARCAVPAGWQRSWYSARDRSVLVLTSADDDGEVFEGFFVAEGPEPDAQQCAIASSLVEFR